MRETNLDRPPPLPALYHPGDRVTLRSAQGSPDPNPYYIIRALLYSYRSPKVQYKLKRDGVCDEKLYFEHELCSVQRLKPKSYKTNAVEDPQESVKNVAVVAGSSATPIKEEEANTTDNDISTQQTPTVATPPPPPSASDDSKEDDKLARIEKLFLDQKAEREARIAAVEHAAEHAADHYDPWHPEAPNPDAQPDGEPVKWNTAPGVHFSRTSYTPPSPIDRGLVNDPFGPLFKSIDDIGQGIPKADIMGQHPNDSERSLGEIMNENIARTEVETPVSTNEKAMEMSDRREVTAEEGYYQRTAIEDSTYGTASHGQSSGVKVALPTDPIAVEQQIDDVSTEYSETSMTESRNHGYMEYLAEDLYAVASKVQCDPQSIQTLSGLLPELLQQFALRIGQEVSRKDGREVMCYVHKHRKRIAELFEQNCSDWREIEEDSASQLSETIPSPEKVTDWLKHVDPAFSVPEDAHEPDTGAPEEDVLDAEEFDGIEKYRKLVSRTSAYTWLLANMARELAQTSEESHVLKYIRHEISRRLPTILKVSPRRPPDTTAIIFQLHWDPMAFISEQRYSGDPALVLEQAITLTGSPQNAQALPCLQYLNQTWPSSGTFVACLIRKLIYVEIGEKVCVRLSDNSNLTAWRSSAVVYIKISGTRGSIIEVGEQIAWLGAALRSSPYNGIAYCQPQIEDGSWTTGEYHRLHGNPDQVEAKVLTISFSFDPEGPNAGGQSQGTCWYDLFRNPVVVSGFPISRRTTHYNGLELPLNMIAGLLGAKRAHIFSDVVFIKGYSAMLVPSKQSDGLLVWHVFHNVDGSRISYLDNDLPPLQDLGFWNLQAFRHIVGWCSSTKSYAGGLEANYKIERSRTPLPGPGCVLEKVSINGGKFITAGLNFAVGAKDVPVHLPCKPYVQKLRWVSSKSIVLWDVAEERGSLVKGTSALLHLLRASLKHYETDAFSKFLLSKFNDIVEPSTGSSDDYSIDILVDERNKKLPIYPDKNEVQLEDDESTTQDPCRAPKTKKKYYRVEDRVEELYETLEKLIDYQIKATGQAGMNMKAHARRRLEGWDFKDLASDKDPIYPHVTTLHALGKGWVDFVRSIQAVTLFGRGFGDIIRPSTDIACRYWRQVPMHRFYLAACVKDLLEIMETHGDHAGNPMQICDGILWYTSSAAYGACQCVKSHDSRHSDFVQTLWPISLRRILPRREKIPLQREGAVIFGHNINFKWKWEDTGNPVEGDSDLELTTAEEEFHDSGIGVTDTLASGPSDQRLSPNGSDDKTSPQYSQNASSVGSGPEHSPARLASLHGTTAPNASSKVDAVEIKAGKSKPLSFRDRIKKPFSLRWYVQLQQKKEGRKR